MQHILTDQEINNMAKDVNKVDLLDLLTAEKGKAESLITDVDELNSVTALQIELNDMRSIIENLNFLIQNIQNV